VKRGRRAPGTPRAGRGVHQALDEVRFGSERTLNLRESLPTAADAAKRTESWLRQQQVQPSGEVLVITGRGNNSVGGVAVVREAIVRLFASLKRRGVVAEYAEHTPGSFVVTLAPVSELWNAPKRNRDGVLPRRAAPPSLDALSEDTRNMLRELAERSLDTLGIRDREPHMEDEMLRQFGALAASIPAGPDREGRLAAALRLALEQAG
jgi:hypothetical protein